MRKETKQRLEELAKKIEAEHDPAKFLKLIQELNKLLDERELRPSHPAKQSNNTSQHSKDPSGSGDEQNSAA